jgi:hypothetical protein
MRNPSASADVRSAAVSTSPDPLPPAARGRAVPAALIVAVALTALEAAGLLVYGLALAPAMAGEKVAMGATTVLFFLCYGAFLAFCAWQLYRLRSWARAPVVLAQLIQLLVGASFWGGSTTAVSVVAVLVALVVLAGIFHPASLGALDGAD